jgi:hypothetical protein
VSPCVPEIRSTLRLPKFFMQSPNRLEPIRAPLKMLSRCCNTEAQSRMILLDQMLARYRSRSRSMFNA